MNTNMTSLDRRLRLLLIAPLAVAIGILIGPGSLGSIALYALAAILLATSPASYCPIYSAFRVAGRRGQPQAH